MSIIQSVLGFCISTWYGSARVEDLKKLWKIIKWSGWNGVTKAKHLEELYKDNMLSLSNKVCDNTDHPLNTFYKVLPSGRRYRVVKKRTSRFRNSFIPISISEMNRVGILING